MKTLRWLATEVEQKHGEALAMEIERFDNISDANVIKLFKDERLTDYQVL